MVVGGGGVPGCIMGQEAGGWPGEAVREMCFEGNQQSQRGAGCLGIRNLTHMASKGCLPIACTYEV